MRGLLSDNRGEVTLKTLFWVLLLVAAAYLGVKLIPHTFNYYMMKTEVEDEAKNAHMYTDEAVRRHIMEKAVLWELPVDEDDIIVDRGIDDIYIEVNYQINIGFPGGYTRVLTYNINVEEDLKETSRILE